MAFYRRCWHILGEDIMGVVKEFPQEAFLDFSSNSTFLTLIPGETTPLLLLLFLRFKD